ncbi:response regulator [Bdellovibrionota bacterium FG-2]
MTEKKYTIMIVDDEADIIEGLTDALSDDYNVISALSGEEALQKMEEHFDLIICDMRMPGIQGYDVLKAVVKKDERIPKILLTGYADLEAAKAAVNAGKIQRYESKPLNIATLKKIVKEELERYSASPKN